MNLKEMIDELHTEGMVGKNESLDIENFARYFFLTEFPGQEDPSVYCFTFDLEKEAMFLNRIKHGLDWDIHNSWSTEEVCNDEWEVIDTNEFFKDLRRRIREYQESEEQ